MMGLISTITGKAGASGFGSFSTAEEVSMGIDATHITALITGGASGIGAETARVLALRGAHVVIAARNLSAASKTRQEFLQTNPSAQIDLMELDLSSLASVRQLASNYVARNLPLNVMINNAGVMFCPYQLSKDGIEMQFATNHLGHFLLTNLLLETMKKTARESGIEGRIVNLSSIAHSVTYSGGILFDAINDKKRYSERKAYGQSKLANILHAKELSSRLKAEGANITANSVHPGLIWTPLMRHSKNSMNFLRFFSRFLWKNIAQGASTTCFVALHPSLNGISDKYFADCNEKSTSAYGNNKELSRRLWDFSEKLTTTH